jgi:flavin-dependent dehydrogenase
VGYNFKTHAPDGAYICLDERLSPKCYAYLVIRGHTGSIAATAPTGQRGMQDRLARVVDGFLDHVAFDMQEPTYFSASISFNLPRTAQKDGRLYVGEAGGFQDLLAGFGMRMGMTSGRLAALSLLEGRDFDARWQARIAPVLKATAVNRWAFELFGDRGYALLVRYARRNTGIGRSLLRRHYHPSWYTPLLWPLAWRGIAKAYPPAK